MSKLDLELSRLPLSDRGNGLRLLRRYGQHMCSDRHGEWGVTLPITRKLLYSDHIVVLLAGSAASLIEQEIAAAKAAGPVGFKHRSKQRQETREEFRKRIAAIEKWAAKSLTRIGPMVNAAAELCMQEQETREITVLRLKNRKKE